MTLKFFKLASVLLAVSITSIGFSQDNSLEAQKAALKKASDLKAQAEAEIAKISAEIARLTPPVKWKKGGFGSLNFNQVGFDNWAAGGVDALSSTALGNVFLNYKHDKSEWINNLDLAYGWLKNKSESTRKNEDKIDFLSKYGKNFMPKLSAAALVNFKSQFTPSYSFNEGVKGDMISKFMAPAFILASLGIDYKPVSWLSLYISPATGKYTIVNDDTLSALGAFGVDPGKKFRPEFGALLNALLQKDLAKNINLISRVTLFNNFTDKNKPNRKNIDVNWENMINMKISKYMGISFFTHMIYDNDIDINYDEINPNVKGPRLQFKEVFGVGLSYKF